ncbi:glycosyltransferase [Algoriphagus lacus]|uniref:Glycosyltransferase n=1 Tax=Algoriphagus lacus TaxID=2056311 RepID=A0A418PPL5_9BACT|nr:glycosyltransferase [Algoriphagus lacus]RIW14020.1 glycosyltransferase [Algoriphagus lacus]
MISFYLVWVLCYFVLLQLFVKKWPLLPEKPFSEDPVLKVTLLIPFRNEQGSVSGLAHELGKIRYPDLEIILIDDQSEDDSFSLFQEKLKSDRRVKILRSPGIGKKAALEFGVGKASGEIVVCTDADCSFPENWIQNLTAPFYNPKVQLVAGPVLTSKQETFFQRFQQIEWSSILLLTHYFFSQKSPLMCSGANLAYRKSVFFKVNGFDQNRQFLSGDDEFLLKKVVKMFGSESCLYLPFAQVLVLTQPQVDFSSLLNQRVRWAGKWRAHGELTHSLSALFPFLVQLIWISSFFLLTLGWREILFFLLIWSGKILSEKLALGHLLGSLGVRYSVLDFIGTGFLHPFYVIAVGFRSFRGNFTWKGRTN